MANSTMEDIVIFILFFSGIYIIFGFNVVVGLFLILLSLEVILRT